MKNLIHNLYKLRPKKPKIVFMGTPGFGAIILERLCNTKFKPCLVITEPDKPMGRKQIITSPPVKVLAQKYNIPVLQPEKIKDAVDKIRTTSPGLIVVATYGKILPKEILEIPKYGCLNIHPSLLPKYRGASPIQYAILNNEKETGVTIILMDEKIDHGPIISNIKYQISNIKISYEELAKKLAELGAELLIKTIPEWTRAEIKPQPQDEGKATYTKILKREDGKIDWKKSADEIERQIRAFQPWPGSWTFWQITKGTLLRIKILKAGVFKSPDEKVYPLGKVLVVPPNKAGIQCGRDFLIIEKLQLEGKKPTGSEEFLRGHPDFTAAILK